MTTLLAGPAASTLVTAGPLPAGVWPPPRPQLLREYSRAQDFHRQALLLARAGWHPVTVTATGVPFAARALNILSLGLLSLFGRTEPALLVTYSTAPPPRR